MSARGPAGDGCAGDSGGPPVEAVIFDWGGTLTPWHSIDLAEQWQVFARQVHAEEQQARSLAERILAAEGAAWRRGREDHSSARLGEILAEAGLDEGDVHREAALTAYREFWEPHTFTDEQVRPLWEGLRARGVRVGVLSNTIWTGDYHRGIFARDGVADLIDGEVYSSEIAWTKPHAGAFRAAAAAVGVAPDRAVYVGDRPFEDVHGSQAAGMRAIWVPHSDIPAEQQVAVEVTPDAVAHELLDILGIVDAWGLPGRG
ncbi:MAG TPA: HAD family hydrolase [Segeticoccus sp.]|uniref:HAD family hydrolase n=1 Tax=Segeticoccus sp. TaxID=2706531 RepID=UPI002D7FAB20|nr:HAD family hydrolase [Segeticoccus sp.]HET8599291.1 HAD family hydrolase [Segeticoccus sp.]